MTTVVADDRDGLRITGASATQGPFALLGGRYGILAAATFGGGNIALQALAADGATWVTVGSAFTAAGYQSLDLPAGQYQLAITTATAVAASVTRISMRT